METQAEKRKNENKFPLKEIRSVSATAVCGPCLDHDLSKPTAEKRCI